MNRAVSSRAAAAALVLAAAAGTGSAGRAAGLAGTDARAALFASVKPTNFDHSDFMTIAPKPPHVIAPSLPTGLDSLTILPGTEGSPIAGQGAASATLATPAVPPRVSGGLWHERGSTLDSGGFTTLGGAVNDVIGTGLAGPPQHTETPHVTLSKPGCGDTVTLPVREYAKSGAFAVVDVSNVEFPYDNDSASDPVALSQVSTVNVTVSNSLGTSTAATTFEGNGATAVFAADVLLDAPYLTTTSLGRALAAGGPHFAGAPSERFTSADDLEGTDTFPSLETINGFEILGIVITPWNEPAPTSSTSFFGSGAGTHYNTFPVSYHWKNGPAVPNASAYHIAVLVNGPAGFRPFSEMTKLGGSCEI